MIWLSSTAQLRRGLPGVRTRQGVNKFFRRLGVEPVADLCGERGANLFDLNAAAIVLLLGEPADGRLSEEQRAWLTTRCGPAGIEPSNEAGPADASESGASRRNTLDGVPLKAIDEANARLEIVELRNSLSGSNQEFLDKCEKGEIDFSENARALLPLNKWTLQNWRTKARRADGIGGLLPGYHYGRRTRKIDRFPEVRDRLEVLFKQHSRWSNSQLFRAIRAEFPDAIAAGLKKGNVRDFRAEYVRDNPTLLASRADRKNKYLVAFGRSDAGLRVGQQVEIDSTNLEVFVLDGKGGALRCSVTVAIGTTSRFAIAKLALVPSWETTVETLRRLWRAAGVPKVVLSDWGSENLNRHVRRAMALLRSTGAESFRALLARIAKRRTRSAKNTHTNCLAANAAT
jgi:hypothetical protein